MLKHHSKCLHVHTKQGKLALTGLNVCSEEIIYFLMLCHGGALRFFWGGVGKKQEFFLSPCHVGGCGTRSPMAIWKAVENAHADKKYQKTACCSLILNSQDSWESTFFTLVLLSQKVFASVAAQCRKRTLLIQASILKRGRL